MSLTSQTSPPNSSRRHRISVGRFVGTAASAVVIGGLFATPWGEPESLAQDHDEAHAADPEEGTAPGPLVQATTLAVERALDRRLTVWRTRERTLYVRHCREARNGCPERVRTFARLISTTCHRYRLDPFLLAAVAMRESGLNPLAAGAAGERGIIQLHPRGTGARVRFVQSESYRQRCARQPSVCQEEILDAGGRLLSRSIDRCGGVREGLGAYNRGECGATDYSTRVMSERQRLLRLAKAQEPPMND